MSVLQVTIISIVSSDVSMKYWYCKLRVFQLKTKYRRIIKADLMRTISSIVFKSR